MDDSHFSSFAFSLPIRLGGLGFRPYERIMDAAYLGAASHACQDLVDGRLTVGSDSRVQLASVQHLADARDRLLKQFQDADCKESPKKLGIPTVKEMIANRNPSAHLQKDWVSALEKCLVFNPSSDAIRVRNSVVLKKDSFPRLWLSTLPSCSDFFLRTFEFNQAIRNYLLLPPSSNPNLFCICPDRVSISSAPHHFHCCPSLRRGPVLARHDSIVRQFKRVLDDQAHLIYSKDEPRVVGYDRKRPDLELVGSRGVLVVEFAVVHPCAPSRLKRGALPLPSSDAVKNMETLKTTKYKDLCKQAGVALGIIVLDAFGGLGSLSKDVFNWCARESAGVGPVALSAAYLRKAMSFAVQRGNALLVDKVFRALHLGRDVYEYGVQVVDED
jgi:hypothetical protein